MFKWQDKLVLKGDKILWYVIIGLMIASVVVVYSSTGSLAYRVHGGNTSHFLFKQLMLLSGCFVVLLVLQSIHYKYFLGFAFAVLFSSFIFLLVAMCMGVNLNEAGRWVYIPGTNITFQPSEMAKLGVIMYTARVIAFCQEDGGCNDRVLLKMIWALPVLGVIFWENFSTSVLLGLICVLMLFVGRLRWKTFGKMMGGIVILGSLLIGVLLMAPDENLRKVGRLATVKTRLETFLGIADKDDSDDTYQSDQAKIAVAKGGLIGVGPGNSVQRNYLPHPYSDFIFAIIIEEYGLAGGGVVMLLFLIILYRVGVIVRRCSRTFPAILVIGLSLSIIFQALVNMGVCVGLFPVTGQPLPLVSMGGTSLLFTSAAFGMILSISHTFSPESELEEKLKARRRLKEEQYQESDELEEEMEEGRGSFETYKTETYEEEEGHY